MKEFDLKITTMDISNLIPYAKNSRKHSQKQIQKITSSIKEFGFTNPVLIDENNGIIAGHCRVMALEKLNINQAPCIVLKGLTEDQKRAYVIADNKLALDADWNIDLLLDEVKTLTENGFDFEKTGFNKDEIEELTPQVLSVGLCDDDTVPEISAEPVTKLGDIYILGNHRLMCGDSTMVDSVEKLMNGNKIDMVYSDPPYGITLETDYKKRYGHEKGSSGSQFYGEDSGIDLKAILANTHCVGAKEVFIWGADNYPDCLPRGGSWVVWDKSVAAVDGIASDFELCWSRERHHYSMVRKLWKGAKAREETGQEGDHRTRWGHPTQKPIELATYFFDKWGKKAETILDMFGGSGTTLIACEKTNRKCFMMELSPQYCDVIVKRWEKFTGKKGILNES